MSLLTVIVLSITLIASLSFINFNNKNTYIDKTPTITNIEFNPIYEYNVVNSLNSKIINDVNYDLIDNNKVMTSLIEQSLNEYNQTLNADNYFCEDVL